MLRKVSAVCTGVLVVAVAAAVGCSGQSGAQLPPGQVLQKRLAMFVAAKSVVMSGTVAMQGANYPVTLNIDDQSGATGSVTGAQGAVALTLTGGKLYLKSQDYFKAQKVYPGARWVLVQNDPIAKVVGALADRRQFVASLIALAGSHVSQRAGTPIKDVPTLQFVSDRLTVTVPAAGGAPLRIATALDQQLSNGLANLSLDVLAADTSVPATPPPSFVDLANKNTLPAHFEFVEGGPTNNFQWNDCDSRGCTLSDLFRNVGGRVDSAHATFNVQRGDTVLGSCQVDLPTIDNGETEREGCRVNYDTSNDVSGDAVIFNPDQ